MHKNVHYIKALQNTEVDMIRMSQNSGPTRFSRIENKTVTSLQSHLAASLVMGIFLS